MQSQHGVKKTKTPPKPRRNTNISRASKITLVMPIRGDEPLALRTMQSARETAGADIDVIAVYEGRDHEPEAENLCTEIVHTIKPVGTSRARHEAVIRATTALVVSCDAHMLFSQGWAVNLSAWYQEPGMRKTIACACTGALSNDFTVAGPATYHGAQFRLKDRNPDNNEHYALCGKWRGENKPGEEIGCLMGAFYSFRRKWYDELGQPWAAGTGWGCDEESLSMSSWLAGGRVMLMPPEIEVWHRMSQDRPDKKPAYESTLEDVMRIWLNRFRLLHIVPMPAELRAELLRWQGRSMIPMTVPDFESRVARDVRRPEVQRIAATLDPARWPAFIERWVDATPPTAAAPAPGPAVPGPSLPAEIATTRPQIQTIRRQREVCESCDALDSFKVRSSQGHIQYLACRKCGAHAVRINNGPLKMGVFQD